LKNKQFDTPTQNIGLIHWCNTEQNIDLIHWSKTQQNIDIPSNPQTNKKQKS